MAGLSDEEVLEFLRDAEAQKLDAEMRIRTARVALGLEPATRAFLPLPLAPGEATVNVKRAAAIAGRHEATVRRWCAGETGIGVRQGGGWAVSVARLDAFLRAGVTFPATPGVRVLRAAPG